MKDLPWRIFSLEVTSLQPLLSMISCLFFFGDPTLACQYLSDKSVHLLRPIFQPPLTAKERNICSLSSPPSTSNLSLTLLDRFLYIILTSEWKIAFWVSFWLLNNSTNLRIDLVCAFGPHHRPARTMCLCLARKEQWHLLLFFQT